MMFDHPVSVLGFSRRVLVVMLLLCVVCTPIPHITYADEEPPPETFTPGWLAGSLSLIPGVVLHGSGHAAAGDWDTATDLLIIEGVGLLGIIAGAATLGSLGASRRAATPAIMVLIPSGGLFLHSWLADIYGAIGASDATAPNTMPWLDVGLGYRYVYDPQFEYRHFSHLDANGRLGDWRLGLEAWVALNDNNQRWRSAVAWRAIGAAAGSSLTNPDIKPDGSIVELELAVVYHRHGTEDFSFFSPEFYIRTRLDLKNLSETLRGSFFDFGMGWGVEMYNYNLPGAGFASDVVDELLGRFAYGFYLGQGRGEWSFFYDHRKDDYAAGLSLDSGTNGPIGHVGLDGLFYIMDAWGVRASFEVGSAYIAGASIVYRVGGQQ